MTAPLPAVDTGPDQQAPHVELPFARLTSATRFVLRALAEGAFAGLVTGLLTGLVLYSVIHVTDDPAVTFAQTVGFYYAAGLYGAIVGVPVGLLAATAMLALIGMALAIRPTALQWRGWPWLAGVLVAVAVGLSVTLTDGFDGDILIGVTVSALAGMATLWRTRAALRPHQAGRDGATASVSLDGTHD